MVNRDAKLPYGISVDEIISAVESVQTRYARYDNAGPVIEDFGKSALTSAISHKMESTLPKFLKGFVKNRQTNGYPDVIPADTFKDDKAKHSKKGVEVKVTGAERLHINGSWDRPTWVIVFRYKMDPFRFTEVYIARLTEDDWTFVPRENGADRYSINGRGMKKLHANWVIQRA